MHDTKCQLIERNGLVCMYCQKTVEYKNIQWHHIKPKYVFKLENRDVDNSYDNASLLCSECHVKIHKYLWWDIEYQNMTKIIEGNKK